MNNHSYTSLYRRILLGSAMLVIVLFAAVSAITRYVDDGKTQEVPAEKPEFGVVRGIVYSPPKSCAVVNTDTVHEGDAICDIAVVAIQSDSVEFSKAGVTWRQEVLETPNRAWKVSAKLGSCDGK